MTWKETHWRTRAFREYPWTLSCMQVWRSSSSFASASWAGSTFWCLHLLSPPQGVSVSYLFTGAGLACAGFPAVV